MKKLLLSITTVTFIGCNTGAQAMEQQAIIPFTTIVANNVYHNMPHWHEDGLTEKVKKIKGEHIPKIVQGEIDTIKKCEHYHNQPKAVQDHLAITTQELSTIIKVSQKEATKSKLCTGALITLTLIPVAHMICNHSIPWNALAALFVFGGVTYQQHQNTQTINQWTKIVCKAVEKKIPLLALANSTPQ